jgi:hypothetical protein
MHSHKVLILCFLLFFSKLALGQNMHYVVDQVKCFNEKSGSVKLFIDSTFQEDNFTITVSDSSQKTIRQFYSDQTNQWTLDKLTAGIYTFILQTKNNRSFEKLEVEIKNPVELKSNIISIDSVSQGINPLYFLKANPTGGVPPYQFAWSANTGNQTCQTAKNLPTGTYTCRINDSNGCGPKVSTFFLYEPEIQKFNQLKNSKHPLE